MPAAAALLGIAGSPFVGLDNTAKMLFAYFTVTPTGNYPALGDPLDLSQLGIPSSYAPVWVEIQSNASGGTPAFWYGYLKGTTQANGKLQVKVGATAVDIGAIAYPALVLADSIVGCAVFVKM